MHPLLNSLKTCFLFNYLECNSILINPSFFIENKSLEAATLIDLANNEIEAEYIYKYLISTKRIDNVLYKMVGYSRKEQENKPTCLEKSNKIKKKSNNIN